MYNFTSFRILRKEVFIRIKTAETCIYNNNYSQNRTVNGVLSVYRAA